MRFDLWAWNRDGAATRNQRSVPGLTGCAVEPVVLPRGGRGFTILVLILLANLFTHAMAFADEKSPEVTAAVAPGTHVSFGFGYGRPQRADVSLTLLRLKPAGGDIPSAWFVQARPGMSAGVLTAGYGWFGVDRMNGTPPYLAFAISGAVMQTWGQPLGAASGASYVGAEGTVNLVFAKLALGQYFRVGSSSDGDSRLTTWSAGFGF